jgi:pilus assembly protein Flp/PilA
MIKKFLKDESGATAIEYALLATLIGVAIIGGATALGGAINTRFNGIRASVAR